MYPDIFLVHFLSLLGNPRDLLVLDAGCGGGRNSWYLAQQGCPVVALDRARGMLRKASAFLSHDGPGPDFLLGRIEALPHGPEVFDAVVCTSVLESLSCEAAASAALELSRVLRRGGHVLAVAAAQEGSDSAYANQDPPLAATPYRARLTTKGELLAWFSGLQLVELLHLRLEHPDTAPVRAQWALMARRPPARE